MSITKESAFESNIEAHLLAHGWEQGRARRRTTGSLGLYPDELVAFVQASQPKKWEQLVGRHGGEAKARQKFIKGVADEIDLAGTIHVLRSAVKDSGVTCGCATSSRRNGLTPDLGSDTRRTGSTVTRQLHHSESNPARLGRPGAVRQRHPGGDGGAEEPADRPGRRAGDDAVPRRTGTRTT